MGFGVRVARRWAGRRLVVVAVVLALVVAGCSDDGPDDASSGSDRPTPDSTESAPGPTDDGGTVGGAAWTLDLPVVGQPIAVGGVAVVYVSDDEDLSLVGVDAATGRQLWSQPASPGAVVTGIQVEPTSVRGPGDARLVPYFRPTGDGDLSAHLVVADPVTGEDRASTGPLYISEPPQPCDDGTDVCVRTFEGRSDSRIRLDLETGETDTEPEPPSDSQRAIGSGGLTDLRVDGVEYLARVDGAEVLWQTPVAEAFGRGWSTNGGWSWVHYREEGLFVGSIGQYPEGGLDPDVEVMEMDLAVDMIVALDAATGAVVWSEQGAGVGCSFYLALPVALAGGDDVAPAPIRCRSTGTASVSMEDDPTFENVDVTLEGFDVATGETTWSVRAGNLPELVFEGGVSAVVDEGSVAFPIDGVPHAVDLRDGSTRPAPDNLTLGCASELVRFEYPEPYPFEHGDVTERSGGTLVFVCDRDLAPVDRPLPADVVAAVGTAVGDGWYVIATEDGLSGYPRPA